MFYIYLSDKPPPHCGSYSQKNLIGNTFSLWFKVVFIKRESISQQGFPRVPDEKQEFQVTSADTEWKYSGKLTF